MTTAIKRLEELLDVKDARIAELEETLKDAEQRLEQEDPFWSLPVDLPTEQTLPVPRLEMLFEHVDDSWYETRIRYRLVYRHLLGHCVAVPLGQTIRRGGDGPPVRGGKIDLPLRDGAHLAHESTTLKLPAFAICGDLVEPIGPLRS